MNTKDYIASGILEQYLLGDLTSAEEKEVEKMISQYPEIRQEYFLLADTFEKMAQQSGTAPPPGLRDRVLEAITGESSAKTNDHPARKFPGDYSSLAAIAAIAALVGLLIAAGIAYNCKLNNRTQNDQLLLLENQLNTLRGQMTEKDQQIQELRNNLQIIGSPDYNQIDLNGLPLAPTAFAQVYWNASTSEVYLRANRLPQPESGKQYQLWAIVNENPQSMGVFDLPSDTLLLRMNDVSSATAFAITLEPQGGVESPTLDAMYVFGNVSS